MRISTTRACAIVALAAAVLPVGGAVAAAAPTKTFHVTSTLDGKTVLPHHLRWRASTTLLGSQVKKVEFLIDGKLRWVETAPPYVYSSNGNGTDIGYLVTSWLTPGRHRFVVRVLASDGRTATDAVTARVLPAAEVPTALAGTWQRTLANLVPADPGATGGDPDPAGTYTITFDKRWLETRDPGTYKATNSTCYGCIIDSDYVSGASTFEVWGAVTIAPEASWQAVGGWFCNSGGPRATYTWSVSGDTLTLAPVNGTDACNQRGTTWTGTWTRVS